jgi:ATP-dependent DNA ligase
LPVPPTLAPMEALLVDKWPATGNWQYEPKWDGFRCLAFKAGKDVELKSKSGRSLSRFFPEVVSALTALPRKRFVLDGELVISLDGELSFDSLQMRLHPARSRIDKLSRETPAGLVAFDCLLSSTGRSLLGEPFSRRREALEEFVAKIGHDDGNDILLSPFTRERRLAKRWLARRRTAIDGIVAKRLDLPYMPGQRAMLKIKKMRTADCVVGGFRYESGRKVVGSLLLGLYDEDGLLHHVGFTSALSSSDKPNLTHKLQKLIEAPGFTGDAPGGPSRWSSERSGQWVPLRPTLVVEVKYDQVTGKRFRHGTRLVRWRLDKAPRQCTFEQIPRAAKLASAF